MQSRDEEIFEENVKLLFDEVPLQVGICLDGVVCLAHVQVSR